MSVDPPAGKATIKGRVTPARAGVPVDVTVTGAKPVTRRVTSAADGSFRLSVALSEKSTVRAVAEGLGSQTLTVEMRSRVRIKVRRLKSGTVVVSGTTSPKLPGRILLLRTNAVKATARTTARNGRFELTPQAYRIFQGKLLERLFSELAPSRTGRHQDARIVGEGAVELQSTKPYEFGDSIANLDIPGSFINALVRNGPGSPVRLNQDDLEIHRMKLEKLKLKDEIARLSGAETRH